MSDVRMTIEQARATSPDESIWVTASAGTGKTHVLTARVLRLLVLGTKANKILCLTYTKAAANEMKTRIFEELGKWTRLSDTALAAEINQRTNEKADGEMLTRARGLFAEVLDIPGGMNIQTIHSFCQSLLSRFPAEASLTPHFKVMDERTTQEYLTTARDQILSRAEGEGDKILLTAVKHIACQKNEEQFHALLHAISSERRHYNKLISIYGSLEALADASADALGIKNNETEVQYLERAFSENAIDRPLLEKVMNMLNNGTDTEKECAAQIAAFLSTPDERTDMLDALSKNMLTKELGFTKARPTKKIKDTFPDSEAIIKLYLTWLLKIAEDLRKIAALENTKAVLLLSDAIIKQFNANKRKQSLMDFDDLIFMTDQLLSQPHIAPWVLYKLDGGIDHIMVDEAQDTNPEQWNMVETLSEEFFASGRAIDTIRSVFAVGDAKQSIYSFQRADPVAFQKAKERIKARAENVGLGFEPVKLNTSFRSTEPVLALTDQVFSSALAGKDLTPDNETIIHRTNRLGQGGLVELWPTVPAVVSEDDENWSPPTTQISQKTAPQILAERMAERISQMVHGGEILASKGRAIQEKDILILVRTRKDFNAHIVRELKAKNIKVAGSDRMVLSEQIAVKDLMALAQFALLPDDDLTLAIVLKSPFIGFDDAQLFTLSYQRGEQSIWQRLTAMNKQAPFSEAYEFLSYLLSITDFETPFQFFSKILNHSGRDKMIARLGFDAIDPMDEFLSIALQYEYLHKPSLQGFVQWMSKDEGQIKRDMGMDRNEVRIMTVHGAKGLQAPIVFLPDTCAKPTDRGETLLHIAPLRHQGRNETIDLLFWSGQKELEVGVLADARNAHLAKQEAEHRRLLYVAMTRAEDRLYICGYEPGKGNIEGTWYDMIAKGFNNLPNCENAPFQFDASQTILRQQVEQKNAIPLDKKTPTNEAKQIKLPNWARTAPKIKNEGDERSLSPSKNEKEQLVFSPLESIEKTKNISRYKRGNLIHKLLEILPNIEPAKRKQVAVNYLTIPAHEMDLDEADAIWSKIDLVLNDPEFSHLFASSSRAEVSLTGRVGKNIISAQIDRLKVTAGAVHIIDYKTNRPPPTDVQDVPPVYLRQMALYHELVQQVYPTKTIYSALLWTEDVRLMPLDEKLLKKHLPKD